ADQTAFLRSKCQLLNPQQPDAQIACLMEHELIPQYCKRNIAFKLLKPSAKQPASVLSAEICLSALLAQKFSVVLADPLKYDDPLAAVLYTMAEVAAFNADRYLALNMVPVTVLRRFTSDEMADEFRACSAWVEKSDQEQMVNVREVCSESDLARAQLFAFLIGQWDNHRDNYVISPDGKLHLIDHERIFETANSWFLKLCDRLQWHKVEPALLARLKALDLKTVKSFWPNLPATISLAEQARYEQLVTDYATELLVRRDIIVAYFDAHPQSVYELSKVPQRTDSLFTAPVDQR
ncbi:MAG TPA: hypothetical protein VJJ83_00115, partial [Candidatus Babeliales bacterium]|nr:hypothetical protein [Candidatus Babeliales bacterium]